jgi:hypothetical protein
MRHELEARHGRHGMNLAHTRENATRTRSFLKRTRLVMLIVALTAVVIVTAGAAGETNAFALPVPGMDSTQLSASGLAPHSSHSIHCELKYAAVLDLAELARHEGKSSRTYQHAFHNVSGQMNDCNSSARNVEWHASIDAH